jgi:hypothetical protein
VENLNKTPDLSDPAVLAAELAVVAGGLEAAARAASGDSASAGLARPAEFFARAATVMAAASRLLFQPATRTPNSELSQSVPPGHPPATPPVGGWPAVAPPPHDGAAVKPPAESSTGPADGVTPPVSNIPPATSPERPQASQRPRK